MSVGRLKLGASCAALAAMLAATAAQADEVETVVVTGFKGSIERALDLKRDNLDATDSILAEDIAKFPDLNLSESIQRIPGVALARDAGEGREISVRGLGPQFTRVRINGMEALATTGSEDSSGGTNRGRAFDFNVFASELFNKITIHKTASAALEEGSLGATVDLRTARPFDYDGFKVAGSIQEGYNDLNGSFNPRGAALVSDTFDGGRIGVLFSVAYAKQSLLEEGTSTVRWQNDSTTAIGTAGCPSPCSTSSRFLSVLGQTSGANYDLVNEAFHPRLPRYDKVWYDENRLGATASFQWQPDARTSFAVDLLYADFRQERQETYLEAPVFSTTGNAGIHDVRVTSYTVDNTNTLVAGTFDHVDLRVEHRLDHLDTKFAQGTLEMNHEFSDRIALHAIGGYSESRHKNPIQTTLTWDFNNANGYSYDYSKNRNVPALDYGTADPTSTTGWFLSQIRLRPQTADNYFKTFQADAKFGPYRWLTIETGGEWKSYDFVTTELRRSNGTTSNLESVIPAADAAIPLSDYTSLVHLNGSGLDIPAGTPTGWVMPNLDKAASLMHLYDPTFFAMGKEPALGNNNSVGEVDEGAYLQGTWDTTLIKFPFRGNLGMRVVNTSQTSTGYTFVTGAPVLITATHKYTDALPSLNMTLEPVENFLIRGSWAKVVARPDLGSLTPGSSVSVSGNNRTVTVGNPSLKPFRAQTADLAFEWYFHKGALLSVALFYKNVDTFVQSLRQTIPFTGNPYGLPDNIAVAACGTVPGCSPSAPWTFTAPINSPGGPVRGVELNYQQPFDMFDVPLLDKFGFLGNFTYVQSKVTYLSSTGTVSAIADLTGLSRRSYNATLYYEDDVLSARVSAAYRSDYITTIPGRNGNNLEGTKGTFNLDAQASYRWDDNLSVVLEGINLTDQFQDQFVDTSDRLSVYHHTGREIFLGIRFNN